MKRDEFLAHVREAGRLSSAREAERWAKAVLTALADLISEPEARRQFATQLPGFLKSHLLAAPLRGLPLGRDAFLQHVGAALDVHAPEAERAVAAVYPVVRKAVAAGELEDFEAKIPRDIAAWLARLR